MTEEMTLREEIIKIIDDTPGVMKEDFLKTSTDILSNPETLEAFVKAIGSDKVTRGGGQEVLRRVVQTNVKAFWEEVEPNFIALCDYWKNHIPSEEVLEGLTDEEFEAIIDEFGGEMKLLFMTIWERFVKKLKKK